jgi:hypothetical protein
MAVSGSQLLGNLVVLGRRLRERGVPVTGDQLATLARALVAVGLKRRRDVFDAARAVLATRREHLPVVEAALVELLRAAPEGAPLSLGEVVERRTRRRGPLLAAAPIEGEAEGPLPEVEEPQVEVTRAPSERELLRRKDFADLTADEVAALRRLLRATPLVLPPRRTRRRAPARRGADLDPRRTLRASLRTAGEALVLLRKRRKVKPRPVVLLLDVSGSMEPYARVLLELAYALTAVPGRLEVFAFGTRLTRITRELARRDADRALKDAAAAVVDWGGGTRIGLSLRRFHADWGRRVLGRGAVVLLVSDGWERGDPALLEREMIRLRLCCRRILWLNPLLGRPGYEPATRGLLAALPHVDDFLPVHNLVSLEQLAEVLRRVR